MTPARDLVLGTAGHIDHGKTALVRALTGVDTDRLPAEKQRGITIDVGFAPLELGEFRVSLVDVPGHERFIRNMLAGATGIDLALLVVAADDSVMPQTREHLAILRYLGLSGGVIALTKCDLVDPGWLDLVEDEVCQLVAGTFLEGAPVVRTSAATGEGIEQLRAVLIEASRRHTPRPDRGWFRLSIDRAFAVAGHGAVVTGTVASGRVVVGDELELWPEGRRVRVRGLQRHDRPAESLGCGARAAINLAGVRHDDLRRGYELATPGYLAASHVLTVELDVSPEAPRPIRHRQRVKLHMGTDEVPAVVRLLRGSEALPGSTALAQLFTLRPVVSVYGQPFVLREESPPATLAGGRILQPVGSRIRRRDTEAVEAAGRLRSDDPATRLVAVLSFLGLNTESEMALCRDTGLAPDEASDVLKRSIEVGRVIPLPVGPRRQAPVAATVVERLEGQMLRALRRLHEARPRASAVRRTDLVGVVARYTPESTAEALIERLASSGRLVTTERTVRLPDFKPQLSQAERQLKDALARALQEGGFSPPDEAALLAMGGTRASVVPELLDLLVHEGAAVSIGGGLWLSPDTEQRLRELVTERLSSDPSGLTMAALRDLLGTSRKFAVPIGEYLDRIGLTRREGDLRFLPDAAP